MNVHEYQAAAILSRYGIPVNRGEVAATPDEVAEIAARFGGVVAVKSQVHTGGRGKAGGIKIARNPERRARPANDSRHGYSRAHRAQGSRRGWSRDRQRVLPWRHARPAEPPERGDGQRRRRRRHRRSRARPARTRSSTPTSIRCSACTPTRRARSAFALGIDPDEGRRLRDHRQQSRTSLSRRKTPRWPRSTR